MKPEREEGSGYTPEMQVLAEKIEEWANRIDRIDREYTDVRPNLLKELEAFKITLNALSRGNSSPLSSSFLNGDKTRNSPSVADTCYAILKDAGVEMTSSELYPRMVQRGKVLESSMPTTSVTTALTRDNRFVRDLRNGINHWSLVEWESSRNEKQLEESISSEEA